MSRLEAILEKVFGESWAKAAAAPKFSDLEEWDSLRYVQLVVNLQADFGIDLSADEIKQIASSAGISRVLEERGIRG